MEPSERRDFGTEAQAGGKRTDTILIVRVDPRAERAAVLSIPRDLWVPIAGTTAVDRVNAAFAGGPTRLIATISGALDIPVHHYVELDFKSFRTVVDKLSGVDFYFPAPVRDRYTGLHVKQAGCVHLDGDAALDLVRSRHYLTFRNGEWREDPTQDFGRIQRQHQFMRLVLGKAVDALRNPIAVNALVGSVTDDLTVDEGFDVAAMVETAKRFRSLSPDSVELLSLPATAGWAGRDSVVFLDEAAARPMVERFTGTAPTFRVGSTTTTTGRPRSRMASTTSTTAAPVVAPTTTTTLPPVAC